MEHFTWRLHDCQAAAMYGYAVNCYPIQQSLWRAEQRLTHILHVRRQTELAVTAWRSRKYALEHALDSDLATAVGFLDHRITALESYYATTLASTARDLSASGIPWLMPVAVGALRPAIGRGRQTLGRMGHDGKLRLGQTAAGEQGSPGWIAQTAAGMEAAYTLKQTWQAAAERWQDATAKRI